MRILYSSEKMEGSKFQFPKNARNVSDSKRVYNDYTVDPCYTVTQYNAGIVASRFRGMLKKKPNWWIFTIET